MSFKFFIVGVKLTDGLFAGEYYDETTARDMFDRMRRDCGTRSVVLYGYPTRKTDRPVLLESWAA